MPDFSFPQLSMEALIVLIAAVLVSIPLSLRYAFYPFQLLFISIHELGHVFATVLTGGKTNGFWTYFRPKVVRPNVVELGKAEREGGNQYFVIPAGHLGVTLFAATLLLLSGWPYVARYTLITLGFLLILVMFNYGRGLSTLTIGLLWGLLFIWVGWEADLIWVVFLLYLVATMAIITTFTSLKGLASAVSYGSRGDDASKMASKAGCSAMFWIYAWTLLSLLVLGSVFWFVWLRTMER